MDEGQVESLLGKVDELLTELAGTREEFSKVVSSIKWNRINTIIQYCLIVIVFLIGSAVVANYVSYRNAACNRSNELKTYVSQSQDNNALAIGVALAAVLGGSEEQLQQYLDVYNVQQKDQVLELREC